MKILKLLLVAILFIFVYNITMSIIADNRFTSVQPDSSLPIPTASVIDSSEYLATVDSESINKSESEPSKLDKLFNVSVPDISSLDYTSIPWGPGRNMNDKNQPTAVVSLMEKYKELGGIFLMDGMNVYLTFDLGYESGYTLSILDTLRDSGVKATFFLTAGYAQAYKDITQRIIAEGHTIGNHSTTHPDMTKISLKAAREEILGMSEIMEKEYGYTPYLFRFPAGTFSPQTLGIAAENKHYSVFWSFAYNDWDINLQPTYDAALTATTQAAHPGAIYLLHPMKTNSEILGQLIKSLQAQGYTPSTF